MFRTLTTAIFLAACCFPALARADDAPAANAKSPEQLAAELDADEFAVRQAASAELAKLGKAGLPALEQAAASKSAEASTRAFEILRNHAQGTDAELQAAATQTLQKIAAGDDASAARRAQEVLKPKPSPAASDAPNAIPGRIRLGGIGGEGIRIRVAAVAGGAQRMSVKNVNGVKDIEVEEEGRKVKIHDDPEAGIEMSVTEKKDGKEETKEYKAKNAEELKEKHPAAHKIYEQYNQAGGAIKIEGFRLQRRFAPAPVPAKGAAENLEQAEKELEAPIKRLEKLIEDTNNADDFKNAIEALEASKKALQKANEQADP